MLRRPMPAASLKLFKFRWGCWMRSCQSGRPALIYEPLQYRYWMKANSVRMVNYNFSVGPFKKFRGRLKFLVWLRSRYRGRLGASKQGRRDLQDHMFINSTDGIAAIYGNVRENSRSGASCLRVRPPRSAEGAKFRRGYVGPPSENFEKSAFFPRIWAHFRIEGTNFFRCSCNKKALGANF